MVNSTFGPILDIRSQQHVPPHLFPSISIHPLIALALSENLLHTLSYSSQVQHQCHFIPQGIQ